MFQDKLVEDSLYTGLSTAPQGRVGMVKDKSSEGLDAFQVVIKIKSAAYVYTIFT